MESEILEKHACGRSHQQNLVDSTSAVGVGHQGLELPPLLLIKATVFCTIDVGH